MIIIIITVMMLIKKYILEFVPKKIIICTKLYAPFTAQQNALIYVILKSKYFCTNSTQ